MLTRHEPVGVVVLIYLLMGLLALIIIKCPVFTFDNTTVKRTMFFSKKQYTWQDVKTVYISKKVDFPAVMVGWPADALQLVFSDGASFILWHGVYSNLRDIRALVTQKLNSRLHFVIQPHERKIKKIITYKRYAGNVFFTFRTLLILSTPFVFMLVKQTVHLNSVFWYISAGIMIALFTGIGFQMNYFEIAEDKLIIKNQYFPWRIKEYQLDIIEEVSRETFFKGPDGLRIITYNYKSRLYSAASLGVLKWDELLQDLSSIGIKIEDES